MRKVLLGLLLVGVLLCGGVIVIFLTVDVNQFRPLLLTKLQDATGRRVELQSLHRSWTGGLGIEMHELTIYDDPHFGEEPLVSIAQASARLRLAPLLQRRVELASITIERPTIRLITDATGQLNVPRLGAGRLPSATTPSQANVALPLFVTSVTIKDAALLYRDLAVTPPLTVDLRHADLRASNLALVRGVPQATLEIRNATLASSAVTHPLEGIAADLTATPTQLDLQQLTALLGHGSLEASGTVREYRTQPAITGRVALKRVAVQEISPPSVARAEQHVEGDLSGEATVQGTGQTWPMLQRSLRGAAHFTLDDGTLKNVNLLREAFLKLSMLPGLVERLRAKLPERHRQLLEQPDTHIRTLRVQARIGDGAIHVEPLELVTDLGTLHGQGMVGFDGQLQLSGMLVVPPDLSTTMISAVNELQALTEASGAITFPLVVSGQVPQRVVVRPDLEYIAKRIVLTKGQAIISELLQKSLGSPATDGTTPSGEPVTPEEAIGELLRGVFDQ